MIKDSIESLFEDLAEFVAERAAQAVREELRASKVKETMRSGEAAEYLGLSKSHLAHLSRAGEIDYYKAGGTLYFKKDALDAYIQEHKRSSVRTMMHEEARKLRCKG